MKKYESHLHPDFLLDDDLFCADHCTSITFLGTPRIIFRNANGHALSAADYFGGEKIEIAAETDYDDNVRGIYIYRIFVGGLPYGWLTRDSTGAAIRDSDVVGPELSGAEVYQEFYGK